MDFITARKEYNLLKRAYLTGAITQEEFYHKIDTELEVTAEDGTVWKIDEDSGVWMVYVVDDEIWVEMPEVYPEAESNDEQMIVRLEVPKESPQVPADVYRDWQKHSQNSAQNAKESFTPAQSSQDEENQAQNSSLYCRSCGQENRPGAKFCTGCGKSILQLTHCPNCGKELLPDSKFCTGCGEKV